MQQSRKGFASIVWSLNICARNPTKIQPTLYQYSVKKDTKCQFKNNELNERMVEMIVVFTHVEDLRKELLTKRKG